jgi:hypothetical protein
LFLVKYVPEAGIHCSTQYEAAWMDEFKNAEEDTDPGVPEIIPIWARDPKAYGLEFKERHVTLSRNCAWVRRRTSNIFGRFVPFEPAQR